MMEADTAAMADLGGLVTIPSQKMKERITIFPMETNHHLDHHLGTIAMTTHL
jgi:hypothetical protein